MLRSAFRRLGAEYTHPATEQNYNRAQIMEEGVRVAQIWQEALLWHLTEERFEYEAEVGNGLIAGQADGILHIEGQRIPVEIKRTEYRQPTHAHLVQIGVYTYLLDAPYGFLIYQHRDYNEVIKIPRRPDEEIMELIAKHDETVGMALDIQEDQGLLYGQCCREKEDDTKPSIVGRASGGYQKGDTRPGTITVSCPFFGKCHPGMDGYKYFVFGDQVQKADETGE